MSKQNDSFLSGLLTASGCILLPIFIGISYLVNGWVFSVLWSWFITETFGIKQVTIPQAIGLVMLFGFITSGLKSQDEKSNLATAMAGSILLPFFTLLFAWVLHSFFMGV